METLADYVTACWRGRILRQASCASSSSYCFKRVRINLWQLFRSLGSSEVVGVLLMVSSCSASSTVDFLASSTVNFLSFFNSFFNAFVGF